MKTKIALFLPSLDGGGAEKMFLNLAESMINQGIEVDIILANFKGPFIKQIPNNANIINLESYRMLYSIKGLINYLKTSEPYALITTLESASIITLIAKNLTKVNTKIWIRIPNYLSLHAKNSNKFKNRIIPKLAKYLYPKAEGIIAISNGVAEDISKVTNISLEEIKVIYNPVVNKSLINKSIEEIHHPWLNNKDLPVILGIGRLTKQKNFECLIKSFKEVLKVKKARLIILGEGEDRSNLEKLIVNNNLIDFVDLPGFVDNPYAFMKKADVFVLSSSWEGFGNVIVESMSVGTPVVCTDCKSGPSEILNNGEYGFLVKVNDIEDMSNKILKILINNPFEKKSIINRSNDFDANKITIKYLDTILINK